MTDVQTTTEASCSHARPGTAPRRAVFAGAGALGAACFLAACGTNTSGGSGNNEPGYTNDPQPAGSSGAGDTGSGSGNSGSGTVLVAAADVPEGGGVVTGDWVVTQPEPGTYKAFSKVCTHQGCDVSTVDAGVIICYCHNSEFSIKTGAPQNGPAQQALPEKKVKRDGDNIVAA